MASTHLPLTAILALSVSSSLALCACGPEPVDSIDTCAQKITHRDYFHIQKFAMGDQGLVVLQDREIYELDLQADERLWTTEVWGENGQELTRADDGLLYALTQQYVTVGGGDTFDRGRLSVLEPDGELLRQVDIGIEQDQSNIRGGFTNHFGHTFVYGDDRDRQGWGVWFDPALAQTWMEPGTGATGWVDDAVPTEVADETIAIVARELGDGFNELLLRRFAADGNVVWEQVLVPSNEELRSVSLEHDENGGVFVIVDDWESDIDQIRLIDGAGETVWEREWGTPDPNRRLISSLPGGVGWVTAQREGYAEGDLPVTLRLLDDAGDEVCQRSFPTDGGSVLDMLFDGDVFYLMTTDRIFEFQLGDPGQDPEGSA